ncbi:hypothetical protein DFR70_10792 [Nocardia tenerifensis]|uniref:Secreted protein n=2 Tax=Nocardia tenerifensis TaxID=228006 RepID=A0A318JY40_9NOCA|nr:hypothetical protein DFR70_10792 [Nocardia tenerifensis]
MASLSALAAAIAVAAPHAGATVTSIRVDKGQSFGSSADARGTGCSYPVTVNTDPGKTVVLLDQIGDDPQSADYKQFQPYELVADASGAARTTWIPDRKGPHKIVVLELLEGDDFEVYGLRNAMNVGTGINLGPACVVLP